MSNQERKFSVVDGGLSKRRTSIERQEQPESVGILNRIRGLAQAAFAYKNTPETVEMAFRDNDRINMNPYNIAIVRANMAQNAFTFYRGEESIDWLIRTNSQLSYELGGLETEVHEIKHGRLTADKIVRPSKAKPVNIHEVI